MAKTSEAKKKREPKKDPRGRPRLKFSQALADRICREVALGKSLRRVLKQRGMPRLTTVMDWLEESATFAAHYTRARKRGIELHIDGLIDLADLATEKNANAVRLRLDTRKWIASKLVPKVYGDKVELSGAVETAPRDAATEIGRLRRIAYALAMGAIAKAEKAQGDHIRRGTLLPAPQAVQREPEPPAAEAPMRDINPPPDNRPKPGDGPVWHYGSAAEQGRED